MFFRNFKNLKINKLSLCAFILINSCTSTQTLNAVNLNPNKSSLDTLKVTRLKKSEISITINQDKSFDKKAWLRSFIVSPVCVRCVFFAKSSIKN